MSGDASRDRIAPAPDQFLAAIDGGLRRHVRERAEEFLTDGETAAERLTCANCYTARLCGSVIAPLIEMFDNGPIAAVRSAVLRAHGVEVMDGGETLCPGKLVRAALNRQRVGDFWIAQSDPLNTARPELQTADALRIAVEDLTSRLDGNLLI